jgi:hypothetical protein
MIVQEKLGLVVPEPVLETIRSLVLLPASWNLRMSPGLKLAMKLFEMGPTRLAVSALAED